MVEFIPVPYNIFNHLLITSTTGTYLSSSMGFGAAYQIVDGKYLFCRPEKFRKELGFWERLGDVLDVQVITQEERILLSDLYAAKESAIQAAKPRRRCEAKACCCDEYPRRQSQFHNTVTPSLVLRMIEHIESKYNEHL